MPSYKLYYFNMKGRAEPARFMFHIAGVPYEDVRFEREEWPKHKEEMPWGQVPVLEVDGKKLAQSNAIYQYLAKQFKLNGKDDWEAAQIQELLGSVDDMFVNLRPVFMAPDEEKPKLMEKIAKESLAPYLDRVQKRLKANGTGHFVGSGLTVADIVFFTVFSGMKERYCPGLVEKYPELEAFVGKIAGLPKIKEWIDKRPKTEM